MDRRSEDEGASGDERPWWHRRQSNEERLANAAEARLLGLAGRPGRGSDHDPPDWHLRRHQPVSYSRPAMQVPACTHYKTMLRVIHCTMCLKNPNAA